MRQVTEYDQVSFDEYLRIEESSRDVRYEYVRGFLHAMVGANRRHNRLVFRLQTALEALASGTTCQTFSKTVKLRTPDGDVYYPDVIVTCGPPDNDPLFVQRPCLLAEVLSPGSAMTDRREKLRAYQDIPTLLTYLILYQDEPRVLRHWRADAGSAWQTDIVTDGFVEVACPGGQIVVAELYANLPDVEA